MTTSIFNGHGYYYNDDRASGGKFSEDDIIRCAHTGKMMKKTDWKMQGGMCMVCNQPICAAAVERARVFGCEGPEEKRIEQAVNAQYQREQNARILGI